METRVLLVCALVLTALSGSASYAQAPAETLGECLTDNTTGRDRKDLARWIFTAMAAHPDIGALSAVSVTERDEATRVVGALFTRLFVEACTEEVRLAIDAGGSSVIGAAFGILGEVAMQELMQNEQVTDAMDDVADHLDMARLEEAYQRE